jgi:folate-binding protein YgfZ
MGCVARSLKVDLLASGGAFADLSGWRKAEAEGADAGGWLNDLVSADLSGLAPGQARRSLLLSPTGRIRAEFTVVARHRGFLLVQDPAQPRPILDLLAPYVLSSDVTLEDRTTALALFAFPGGGPDPSPAEASVSEPSALGAGADLLVPSAASDQVLEDLSSRFAVVRADGIDAWRVLAAIPRFGVDATEEDLPQEAGLADAVAFDKGCYLGQEAVAKVRNLGHPRRLVVALRAERPVAGGDPILAGDGSIGTVTSVAADGDAWAVLGRVAWDARDADLSTGSGVPLTRRR